MQKVGAGVELLSDLMAGIAHHEFENAAISCEVLLTSYNKKELDKILYSYCKVNTPIMIRMGIPPDNFTYMIKKIFKKLMILRKTMI